MIEVRIIRILLADGVVLALNPITHHLLLQDSADQKEHSSLSIVTFLIQSAFCFGVNINITENNLLEKEAGTSEGIVDNR